ncbi:MAG: elongation factor P [Candidatus Dojkabacteria bacterium]|nr:elongation factor P [Candidatus Dojkabacteria bacterium]
MAGTTELRKGMIIMYNNEPHVILDKEFYSPGKGGAFNRCKLKSIRTGKLVSTIFKSGEKVEELDVVSKTVQYVYHDSDKAVFMDPNTFEQYEVSLDSIAGGSNFLQHDAKYILTLFEDAPIYLQVPLKIVLQVVETPEAVKGDTVSNATKEAVLETGLRVQVPLFIKQGDKILVNTETGEYFSKA